MPKVQLFHNENQRRMAVKQKKNKQKHVHTLYEFIQKTKQKKDTNVYLPI